MLKTSLQYNHQIDRDTQRGVPERYAGKEPRSEIDATPIIRCGASFGSIQ